MTVRIYWFCLLLISWDMTVHIYWFCLLLITIIYSSYKLTIIKLITLHVTCPFSFCSEKYSHYQTVIGVYEIKDVHVNLLFTARLKHLFFNDCQFSNISVWIYVMNRISLWLQIPRKAMNSSFEYLTNTNYNGLLRPEVLIMLLLKIHIFQGMTLCCFECNRHWRKL